MEFCLHYYGKLKSRDNAAGKHAIRQALHEQVKSLCVSEQFVHTFKEDLDGKRRSRQCQVSTYDIVAGGDLTL